MKIKKFIESKYFELPEVHALNTFLKNLPKSDIPTHIAEEVFALSSLHAPFESLEKYVPDSEPYNKIVESTRVYKEAQEKLKEYKYSAELILDECYPDYLTLYKHTLTIVVEGYDFYDDVEFSNECTYFFYSLGFYKDKIVYDPALLVLPYTNKERWSESQDLISNYIRMSNYAVTELQIYKECNKKGWDPNVFKNTFGVDNIELYSTMFGDNIEIVDTNTGKKYTEHDIVKLMEDYKVAKTKKYIKDNEYVKYPHITYLSFLELLGTKYMEDTVKS